MASLEEKNRKRPPRKLVKKKRPEHSKLQYPRGLELGEDADEDVTMPQGQGSQYYHLNQSVFSIIAAAGSKSDFHGRFDEDSSGSDTEQEGSSTATFATKGIAEPKSEEMKKGDTARARSQSRPGFGQRRSESKLLRSLPKLNIRTKRERNYMSQSMILPPKGHGSPANPPAATPRDAPVMSRILEAQAQLEREEPEEIKADGLFNIMATPKEEKKPVSLEQRLMEIFGLKGTEEVVAEYPCWLLQSVLLQGYMYITSKHICFYAYLPKKSTVVAKSGHLAKRGKSNPRYNRYWFRLQGDVLSYYTDSSNLYFPNGNIDLRYGISAALSDAKEKSKDTAHFTVTTHARMYHFKADSPASAKEWVRTLQKVIFRSRNEGDSVKISLPLENVVDIEESPVIDFADTFKIRVIDNDETFAIDEYFFSFFSFGKDALNVLRALVDTAPASRFSTEMLSSDRDPSGQGSPHPDNQGSPLSPISQPMFRDSVKATLSPGLPLSNRSSPRVSGEWGRRSFDTSRRSMEVTLEPHHEGSSLRRIFGDRGRSVSAGRVPSL
ncbi:MAG: hypothetical protein LQ340_005964 [Diploschistes diacapsis]|nr:MAG: hypothetical protein LQ340_005964 [Diploschistes diacapsis]